MAKKQKTARPVTQETIDRAQSDYQRHADNIEYLREQRDAEPEDRDLFYRDDSDDDLRLQIWNAEGDAERAADRLALVKSKFEQQAA